MTGSNRDRTLGPIKKEIEDFFKSWFKKIFQRGVRDANVYLGPDTVVLLGYEVLSYLELSILDDSYSRQAVAYTRRKAIEKNFPVLKQNLEIILNREIDEYYADMQIEQNVICMTLILKKEDGKR